MTSRELGNVALKVLGIYILLLSIQYIPIIVSYSDLQRSQSANFITPAFIASQVLVLCLYVGFGLWLFVRTESLSTKLFKDSGVSDTRLTPNMFQAVLFSAVGIFILANSVADVGSLVHRAAVIHQNEQNFSRDFWIHNLESIIALAVKLPLGFYLFFGSEGISHLWSRLRPMARKPED